MNHNRTTDATMDSIREAIEACRNVVRPDVPEVYVMTDAMKRRLLDYVKNTSLPVPATFVCSLDRMCGVPLESFPTMAEVYRRAWELRSLGKKVGLVTE